MTQARAGTGPFRGPGTSRLWSTALPIALVMAGAIPWGLFARDLLFRRDWVSGDFVAFFAAARLVAAGAGSHVYELQAVAAVEQAAAGHAVGGTGILPYFNPPFFAWLLRPVAGLSLESAYRAWSMFSLLWLAIDAWLLWRIAAPLSREWRRVIVVAFVALFPVAFGLQQGQCSLILEGSWSAAYLLLRARRPAWAGVALSPMFIKPELLLPAVLFFAWKREWRLLGTLSACGIVAVVGSIAIVGAPSALAYPDFLLDSTSWSNYGNTPVLMFGWNGVLAASTAMGTATRQLVATGLGLTTLGVAAYLWRAPSVGHGRSFAIRWLALSLASMLIDQHFYFQDIVMIVPGIVAVLASAGAQDRRWIAAAAGLAWCGQLLATYPNESWHVNILALLAVAALGALAVRDLARARRFRQRRIGPGDGALLL
ncbi:MAG TPA: glycosyltransferase family 87 protein [Tepidiformaceae bacterium]